ncbi:MAG: helix-turn-helix transcriptional regulator [Lachnospiraceae bacterium]|nr:helix-turn-helix transcriptional regulator [Lachnospiraceae bacterium]
MFKFNLKSFSSPGKSIVRWFLICFVCFSLIFFIALLPLISYCRNVFTELEIKKGTQQMDFGITQIENTITGIASASESLRNDVRFIAFRHLERDYSSISVSVRTQMAEYLSGLTFPLTLVSDCALQFAEYVAVTPSMAIFEEKVGYYPNRFCVADLTYQEWKTLLAENRSGFLPVHQVTSLGKTYDALIYSIPWTSNSYTEASYFYVCMNISDIRKSLIAEADLDSYYLTIENNKGVCLYTDLNDTSSDYYSVTQNTSMGGLVITVHIPHSALTERMSPLYYFLALYLVLCVLAIMIMIYIGSHLSSRPLLKIVDMLENSDEQPSSHTTSLLQKADAIPKAPARLQYGFHYIQNKVKTYESNLIAYRSTIDTQAKVLQARFLEKALHGSLATDKDYELFFSYFPNFPESFCLVLFGLMEKPEEDGNLYPDVLSLIQIYLQNALPNIYLQQLDNSQLLLIIDEEEFGDSSRILNHLVDNINREEPSYHAWGITSKFYCHPKSIPSAYWQVQDLYSWISLESLSQLCTVSDYQNSRGPSFQMADALSLHTAITYGNEEVALLKLQSYSDSLNAGNRSIFEMLRAILLCIKQEYATQLIDVDVPSYHSHLNLYGVLEKTICAFCGKFQEAKRADADPFTQQVKDYIDLHYTEYDMCLTKLAEHFRCSSSKIQKTFSKELDTSVSAYIEKKRMELANELLCRGEDTVIEVANKCGFVNESTFYKAYRRVFGHTPKSVKQG